MTALGLELELRADVELARVRRLAEGRSDKPLNGLRRPSGPRIVLQRGSDIELSPIRWLWQGWLAQGKVHVLAGSPGTGKTTIACSLAAAVTVGGCWPDGSTAPLGNVLIWSGEDDPADTLAPRILAAGGDLSRTYFVEGVRDNDETRPFDPARDLAPLQAEAEKMGNVALVIADPIVSAVSGDGNNNAEVRRSLQPIVHLASALNCALLGISHFAKGSSGRDPVERVNGSIAFGAVARVVMVAARNASASSDAGDAERILARAKSNIGLDGGGYAYALEPREVFGLATSAIRWGDALIGTARELLAEAEPDTTSGEWPKSSECVAWLQAELVLGERDAAELQRNGGKLGYSTKVIRRAREKLGVRPRKQAFAKGWAWALPAVPPNVPKMPRDVQPGKVGALGTFAPGHYEEIL